MISCHREKKDRMLSNLIKSYSLRVVQLITALVVTVCEIIRFIKERIQTEQCALTSGGNTCRCHDNWAPSGMLLDTLNIRFQSLLNTCEGRLKRLEFHQRGSPMLVEMTYFCHSTTKTVALDC